MKEQLEQSKKTAPFVLDFPDNELLAEIKARWRVFLARVQQSERFLFLL